VRVWAAVGLLGRSVRYFKVLILFVHDRIACSVETVQRRGQTTVGAILPFEGTNTLSRCRETWRASKGQLRIAPPIPYILLHVKVHVSKCYVILLLENYRSGKPGYKAHKVDGYENSSTIVAPIRSINA
jgi:hypothetical protein